MAIVQDAYDIPDEILQGILKADGGSADLERHQQPNQNQRPKAVLHRGSKLAF